MPRSKERLVVFVHGWSVHNTDTYGEFPARLKREARARDGVKIDTHHIYLSKYISFRDEVRLEDISRAFQAAVVRELKGKLTGGRRFICITHSTGGPVLRDWLAGYYGGGESGVCPLSHLVMLAPANFGSALAQLGKGRLGRLKAWMDDIEPGQGVLDWLELGSPESWRLNRRWCERRKLPPKVPPVFQFVLTGQWIDRKFYDHINSYTGELGSDGVVRAASANLNAGYVLLRQEEPGAVRGRGGERLGLELVHRRQSRDTAFLVLPKTAHSGDDLGIMRRVRDDRKPSATVEAVLDCIGVGTTGDYRRLCRQFADRTEQVQRDEQVEAESGFFRGTRYFIRDKYSMVVFRVQDDRGYPIEDFDLKMTAGRGDDPNHLPEGFFMDRQRNSRHRGTVTYFLNHTLMKGGGEVRFEGAVLRPSLPGANGLGLRVTPHVTDGFVHHLEARLPAAQRLFARFLRPNQTTLVDIVLRRIVRRGVFELTRRTKPQEFKKQRPGGIIDI